MTKSGGSTLALVRHERRQAQARQLRAALFGRCRAAVDQLGDDIAGFALVVWDHRGDMYTAYDTTHGPIGFALVPTLAADALNRHIAVKLAEERIAERGTS